MKANFRISLTLAALCLATVTTGAQSQTATVAPNTPRTVPAMIHDAGGTPIGQYLEVTQEGTQDRAPAYAPVPNAAPTSMAIFPVVTTKAAPGRLTARPSVKLKGGPGVPICILGDDPLSLQWLQINQVALQKMNATCLAVTVRDEASWRKLQSAAGGLPLTPGSFDALATAMGVSVYPILVSPEGLVSQ